MVDYMDEFANTAEGDTPLPVDYAQRAVGVEFPDTAPEAYAPGDTVEFELSSLSMSAPTDERDQGGDREPRRRGARHLPGHHHARRPRRTQQQRRGRPRIGVGRPPGDVAAGEAALTVTGATTGTSATVPIPVASGELPTSTVSATAGRSSTAAPVRLTSRLDPTEATGDVQVFEGETLLGEQTLTDARYQGDDPARTLKPGSHTLRVVYVGDERFQGSETELSVVVGKAKPVMTVKTSPRRIERRESARSSTWRSVRSGSRSPAR